MRPANRNVLSIIQIGRPYFIAEDLYITLPRHTEIADENASLTKMDVEYCQIALHHCKEIDSIHTQSVVLFFSFPFSLCSSLIKVIGFPFFSFWPVDRNISLSFIPRSDWIGQLQISDPSTIFLLSFCVSLSGGRRWWSPAYTLHVNRLSFAVFAIDNVLNKWKTNLFYFEKKTSVRIEKGKLIASKPFVFLSLFESDWISVFSPSFFENKSTDNWFLSLFLSFIHFFIKERKKNQGTFSQIQLMIHVSSILVKAIRASQPSPVSLLLAW